ncbi:hypothetical protein SAMN02910447_01102 [Ruminococcus sp. YE71]|uniref:alpha/beta hydrolase n=1 Tax=unclassified Ruminococcus TaxID=2608920 RepID=UPI0008845C22|nr:MULTISPECIES: alpha/beta fold hydrolase [unclassified Ruminococcus]SDA16207.1 hypothetical protein SAMN02910446_01101 [Ruminococcus sp. YE78]SFW24195.1 hypothetical protein SAMN02910447_01102 [Ruminococcus sp. YE71]
MKTKTTSKKKKIILIILIVLFVLNIADCVMSVVIYKENFDKRFTTPEPFPHIEEFAELGATKYTFPSDKGQMLTGYMYRYPERNEHQPPHGIIVMAHGFGGGHKSYMNIADWFAAHDYLVFAYDATGNDESGGDAVGGLPQGVIDLDHAISFVEEKYPDMPIALFGHSWGGYSVMSVLKYHPEVKAVAECSGFAAASDMFEIEGKNQAGAFIYAMLPYVKLYDRIKFGKYAANGALDGFAQSDTPAMIIHSADDDVVPIAYGYDKIYKSFGSDPRFEFIRFEDAGHNHVYDSNEKREILNGKFEEWLKARGYDYEAPENAERLKEDKAYYMSNVMDKHEWNSTLNDELFEKIDTFYKKNLTN